MKYFIISDDADILAGMRLAGIDGRLAKEEKQISQLLNQVKEDESVAVLLITESCADMCRNAIDELRLSAARPLVAVIPGRNGEYSESDAISRLIRETIGVRI